MAKYSEIAFDVVIEVLVFLLLKVLHENKFIMLWLKVRKYRFMALSTNLCVNG